MNNKKIRDAHTLELVTEMAKIEKLEIKILSSAF